MSTHSRGQPTPVTIYYFPKRSPRPTAPTRRNTFPDVESVPVGAIPQAPGVTQPRPVRRSAQSEVAATYEQMVRDRAKTISIENPLPEGMLRDVAGGKRKKTVEEVVDLVIFGHQLFERGKIEEARVIFEGLVDTDKKNAFAHTMLGTIYLALKDGSRALALFQAALAIDPHDVPALVYRGELRLKKGKTKSALEDLERAVGLGEPGDAFVERAKHLIRLARRGHR